MMIIKNLSEEKRNIIVILIVIVSFFSLFAIPAFCQETSGVTYETVQTEIFFKDENPWYQGGIMIDFRGDYILTTFGDQMSKFYINEPWREGVFTYGDRPDWNHLEVQAKDNSGSKCYLYYGYDTELKAYKLWVVYKNVYFCHWMQPTGEKMYDILDEWPEHNVPNTIEYTEAEMDEFLKNFGFLFVF